MVNDRRRRCSLENCKSNQKLKTDKGNRIHTQFEAQFHQIPTASSFHSLKKITRASSAIENVKSELKLVRCLYSALCLHFCLDLAVFENQIPQLTLSDQFDIVTDQYYRFLGDRR